MRSDSRSPLPPPAPLPRRRLLQWLERLLLVIGLVALGYYGYVSAEAALYQAYETRELEAMLSSGPANQQDAGRTSAVTSRARSEPGSAIGFIVINRLG